MPKTHISDKFRTIAASIRNNPHDREAIADGFDLIADEMGPCEDCDHPSNEDFPVIEAADLPDAGIDTTNKAA